MSKKLAVKMPERAKPDPAAMDAFVHQGKEEAPVRTPPRTNGEGATVRLNLNMREDLHRTFKTACAAQGVTISEVVTQLVREWTDRHR